MSANFTDGNFTLKWPVGKARTTYPIDGDVSTYILEQDYMQLKSSYSAAALNTTHYSAMGGASPTDGGATGDSSAYLVGIGPHADQGQGVIMWTETYSTKPAARNEYESFSYNFIGVYGAAGETTITGRDRFTKTVMSRLAYAYYIPGVDGGITTAADIPLIDAQRYVWDSTENDSDWLADSPPFTDATDPTRTTYEGWIGSTEIVAEESVVRRWMGGIYERVTRYIVAQ